MIRFANEIITLVIIYVRNFNSMLIELSNFVRPTTIVLWLCVVSGLVRQCRKLIFILSVNAVDTWRYCTWMCHWTMSTQANKHLHTCDLPIVWHYTTLHCICECTICQAMRHNEKKIANGNNNDIETKNGIQCMFGHGLNEWISTWIYSDGQSM